MPRTTENLFSRRGPERPLYPIAVLGTDYEIKPAEIVRFGGRTLARNDNGDWHLVEHVDIGGLVETED
jgi:hypothetical protein